MNCTRMLDACFETIDDAGNEDTHKKTKTMIIIMTVTTKIMIMMMVMHVSVAIISELSS